MCVDGGKNIFCLRSSCFIICEKFCRDARLSELCIIFDKYFIIKMYICVNVNFYVNLAQEFISESRSAKNVINKGKLQSVTVL